MKTGRQTDRQTDRQLFQLQNHDVVERALFSGPPKVKETRLKALHGKEAKLATQNATYIFGCLS